MSNTIITERGRLGSLQITDSKAEKVFLHSNGIIRKIRAYSPESFLCDYSEQVKDFPEINISRAIYVICRNMFVDRVWNSNVP